MRTLVLGLGNSILSDDNVGLCVAQALRGRFDEQEVTVMESDLAGLGLLDALVGYQRAIIVDSIQTKEGKPGQIYRLGPEDLMASRHSVSPHDVNLLTALELGKTLELEVPQEVIIIAIEVTDVTTFGESCTPEVAAAIPQAVEIVAREVKGETPV